MAMAINPIQMQPGLSLTKFLEDYGTEAQCEEALKRARWPNGFRCPKCKGEHATEFMRKKNRLWECLACGLQTSLTAGTMMHQSRLPLTKWFLAIYLVTQSKTNIAALALRRQLGISWKAAWLLKHKLMEAMRQREDGQPLDGDIRVDDAYLGGERTGGKVGRGSENKTAFVAAVEMREGRPQRVRFDPVKGFSFDALRPWADKALMPGSIITSDGLLGFEVVRQLGFGHQVVIAPKGKAGTEIDAFKWLNVLLGNLKTTLIGTHHAFKFSKYAPRYLAEVQYRFNRRFDLKTIIPRLLVAIVLAKPCPRGRSDYASCS
jgi:ribosomal protein L37AE/L43A